MPRERKIDPITRDYVRDGAGGYVYTTTSATKIFHQIVGRRGSWWANAAIGSDCHRIRERNLDRGGIVAAENSVRTALQLFIDRGLISDLRVEVEADARGRIALLVEARDSQGEQIDLSGLAPFGGTIA